VQKAQACTSFCPPFFLSSSFMYSWTFGALPVGSIVPGPANASVYTVELGEVTSELDLHLFSACAKPLKFLPSFPVTTRSSPTSRPHPQPTPYPPSANLLYPTPHSKPYLSCCMYARCAAAFLKKFSIISIPAPRPGPLVKKDGWAGYAWYSDLVGGGRRGLRTFGRHRVAVYQVCLIRITTPYSLTHIPRHTYQPFPPIT